MSIIKWKEVYATGIVALDQEHQDLVKEINRLYEALRDKRGEEVLTQVLDTLLDYTESHFQHEERLLAEYGFPGLAEHQAIHQQLRDSVEELKERSTVETETVARELYQLLRQWLLEHIVEVDNNYGAYLESRGGRFIS